jgi:hypothetical protein
MCEQYYYGHQWVDGDEINSPYTINLIFPTVEVRLPSLFFKKPDFKVEPRPAHSDDSGSMSADRAKLAKDTLNTMLSDPRVYFTRETQRSVKEAFWAFGVTEVGYTADYIDNPNVGRPLLKEDGQPYPEVEGEVVLEPNIQVIREGLYFKRIPAKAWRVSVNEKMETGQLDWCGYYEWHYPEDIRKNKRYKNTTTIKADASTRPEYSEEDVNDSEEEKQSKREMVKVWKIWDMRAKKRIIFPNGGDKFFVDGEPYKFLPFSDLRFHERSDHWYPLPPLFNWISPQDELNETREMQKVHRKRMYRRYLKSPNIADEQMQKLETGGDGVWIDGKDGDVVPIPNAELDSSAYKSDPLARLDFREISGASGDQRGVVNTETATQASIIDTRLQIREDFGRTQVAVYLSNIGRIALLILIDKMALPFWIKVSVDPFSPTVMDEALRVAGLWQQISSSDLEDFNFDITVDVSSLSPVGETQDRNNFFQSLAVITSPQFGGMLLFSDVLLKKALAFFGVTTEREIQEIKKALQAQMMMAAQAAAAQNGSASAPPRAPGNGPDNSQGAMQVAKQSSGGVVQ